MKFTLKDYQDEAVRDVLVNLRKAKKRWNEDADKHAFSLTATTGAGKTVMAAAVFEALFFGDDIFEFQADPGAVVIWFSDDPSLNEQSRWRLNEASDRLTVSNLVTVEADFSREKFEPGKIYFLNTQKLSKNSLLVRGHNADDEGVELDSQQFRIMPDLRSHTIWDTIQNTIEDPCLTLYLILDEAHRGMREVVNSRGDNKPTIVKQLINGKNGVPGIPIVWGISATVNRFNEAIKGMQGRATLPNVVVDSKKVQESGLLKDTINLAVPDEVGDFSTVLLRKGTRNLKEVTAAWDEYSRKQHDINAVLPLMVLQVPNSPDHNEIGKWLDTIAQEWPELPSGCYANVFGEHRTELFGQHSVPYIAPERVQESEWVRILIAKDAISTGWDCPRAEVMVSFRSASDKTHIAQLLGRMVRTPLARRIPGNERLNSVDCLLPYFNKGTVDAVVSSLVSSEDESSDFPGRRVLINPKEIKPNPIIPETVWDKFISLPSQSIPKRESRPIRRLTALAHELASDGLLQDAGKLAYAELHQALDDLRAEFASEISEAREAVLTVEGMTVTTDIETQSMSFNQFVEESDFVVIEDAYKRTARSISTDLARTYSEYLASSIDGSDDLEDSLVEAHTIIAALGLVPKIKEKLEVVAEKLATQWLNSYAPEIKKTSDDRQDIYREIREMSSNPLDVELARPHSWLQPTILVDENGKEIEIPRYSKHLLCDEEGLFPASLNSWEESVLSSELQRPETIAWYRNPERASQDSLGIVYEYGKESAIVRPDFIFFTKDKDGVIAADIVDPHGHHLAEALPKLRGLSAYFEENFKSYRRFESVAETNGTYRVLDLTNAKVREAIRKAETAIELYRGKLASDYILG